MKQFILKFIADLRFAIILLLLIAGFSILGTIIEQDQTLELYQTNYPIIENKFLSLNWKFILEFGLDHVYKTWWFISLLLIFGVSLLSCTFLQQLPSLKIARRCQFFRSTYKFKKLKISEKLQNILIPTLIYNLEKNDYSIFQQRKIIYSYKGLVGRIAPIIVHISMILILLGSVSGAVGGLNAQEIIPKTEIFHVQNILSHGPLTNFPRVTTRINDFWITYNSKTTIDQFYSNLSFLDNFGKEIENQTISVNHPAKYKNLTFYQTDWNLVGIRFKKITNEILQYPLINPNIKNSKIWISWLPFENDLNNGITLLVNNLQGYVSLYDKNGNFINTLEINDTFNFSNPLTLIDIISTTGLQIKTDPGIFIIYTGFGLLMLSTLISYKTYSQIWIVKDKNEIFIGGNTNRAKMDFIIEFKRLLNDTK